MKVLLQAGSPKAEYFLGTLMSMKDRNALDRLEKRLDSRGEEAHVTRSSLSSRKHKAPSAWENVPTAPRKKNRRRLGVIDIIFFVAVAFFLVAGTFAALTFFSGNNIVSTRNVAIAIDAPTEVRAGDTVSFNIAITNRNSVPMELTDLVVEFPAGTRSETDISVALPRIRESIGTIEPGESVSKNIRAVIFGTANTDVEVGVVVEYRVPSSNAIFFSDAKHSLLISQSPASIRVDGLQEVVSGQETAFTVTVSSNVDEKLASMLLVAEYPPGFSFVSSTPAPASGSNVWRLGDIQAGGSRAITIRGRFQGEDGDERVVNFTAGGQDERDEDTIAAPLATGDLSLKVAKPFLSASLALGGSVTSEYVASRGTPIRGDIRWVNNLEQRIQDVEIVVTLSGAILDRNTVSADRGFYRSSDNTIIFSKESDGRLADIAPGGSGVSSFSFAALPESASGYRNPEIDVSVRVRARRVTESQVPETVESSAVAKVLISTDLALSAVSARKSGPVPPKADQETVYSITWVVTNSANAVANASVTATLPSYVKWLGGVGSISYNPVGGSVTWNVGDLAAGESASVTFDVGVTPSLSQVGTSPTIITNQRIYGIDRFTRAQIERIAQPLTTGSGVRQSDGLVVP